MSGARKGKGGDYEVGYGRPPKANQFTPGKSGNPDGRPKRKKSIGTILEEKLQRRIEVNENGVPRKVTMLEVIITGLVNDAARRGPRAVKHLTMLLERHRAVDESMELDHDELIPEEQEILDAYYRGRVEEERVRQAEFGSGNNEAANTADAEEPDREG